MVINGEKIKLKELKLSDFLAQKNLKSEFVAVELNGKIVPKSEFESLVFKEKDKVEIVNFVGGG